ncbi:MAG: DNA polymerase III subunit beta, partial [Sulfurovum sp. 35-42-20]
NVEAKTELKLKTGLNDKFEISYNSKYILDFISQINKNEFTMEFNEPTLPFIVKDDNFITIIMPIVA